MTTERTRTIWEGRCPECGENGLIPDTTNGKILEVTRWCEKCQRTVDCTKTSFTGPELTPMIPNVHHIWCNGQRGPVVGCQWCCPLNADGLPERDGMWMKYPYDPATGPSDNFAESHFPGVIRRT